MRNLIFLFVVIFHCFNSYSQRIGTKRIDSLENVINQTFKTDKYIIDSGKLYNQDSSQVIGRYKMSFQINKSTGDLDLAIYQRRLRDDTSTYETFYFSENKPMTAYRMTVIPKHLQPEKRFLIVSSTYEWEGHKLTLSKDEIKKTALRLLNESKKYK